MDAQREETGAKLRPQSADLSCRGPCASAGGCCHAAVHPFSLRERHQDHLLLPSIMVTPCKEANESHHRAWSVQGRAILRKEFTDVHLGAKWGRNVKAACAQMLE